MGTGLARPLHLPGDGQADGHVVRVHAVREDVQLQPQASRQNKSLKHKQLEDCEGGLTGSSPEYSQVIGIEVLATPAGMTFAKK
jgi:hypothetical protein